MRYLIPINVYNREPVYPFSTVKSFFVVKIQLPVHDFVMPVMPITCNTCLCVHIMSFISLCHSHVNYIFTNLFEHDLLLSQSCQFHIFSL